MVTAFVHSLSVLARQAFSLFLNGLRDLTMMVVQKYSLAQFNTQKVTALFDYIHSRSNKSFKILKLIESEKGWTGHKTDGDLQVSFKQVG